MQDDDFELSLFPKEEPEESEEEVEITLGQKPPVFDWEKEDPQDFSHAEKPAPVQEKPAQAFEQPLFVQDTFDNAPAPSAPPLQEPYDTRMASAVPPVPVPQPTSVPRPVPVPTSVYHNAAISSPVQTPAVPKERVSNGRTVLISGGDRGIGAAAARLFWQQGYHTAILYHKDEVSARELINDFGRDCMAVRCDVSSREACEAAMRVVVRTFGDPDVLVCNAGIAQQKLFTDLTEEDWQQMLAVDLTGTFHLCQLCLPGMIRRKYGRIINISSMWGQTGGSCEVHYSAAKAGVIGLTRALAKEEGPSGITVNCIAPGVIETDMMNAFSPDDKKALAEETPVGRLGKADEVARMIVYLAAEKSGYITGQVFGVNGGLVI